MIKIYHNPNAFNPDMCIRYYHNPIAEEDIPSLLECELVAVIYTEEKEAAFRLSQTIESFWWVNPGVDMRVNHPVRSTSIGDLLVDGDGIIWIVAVLGFQQVTRIVGKSQSSDDDILF